MIQLYTCVAHQHDLRLVAVAAIICALGTYSTFAMGRQVLRDGPVTERLAWAITGVGATSTAIWATHFIAMLAYEPSMAFGFAIGQTVASLLVAIVLVGLGAGIVLARRSLAGRVIGGGVIGLAISAMHYTGMNAYYVQGTLNWDGLTVAVSVAVGVGLGSLSMVLGFSADRRLRRLAPLSLLGAVCGMHFLGMSAVTIAFDPQVEIPGGSLDATILSILTANAAFLIVGSSLAALRLWHASRRRNEAENQRLRNLADIAVEGLMICDGDIVTGINHSLERVIGLPREALIGAPLQSILPGLSTAEIPTEQEADAVLQDGARTGIPVRVIARRTTIKAKPHIVVAVRDQRERLRAEAEMHRLAHHDALTGLANRHQFNQTLAARLSSRRGEDGTFALLLLDLDRFKLVNDTLGHAMGDALLRRVAHRLQRALSEDDLVARLGGDEFAVIKGGGTDLPGLQALAERVNDILARPFLIDGHILNVGTSIGIALAPSDGCTPNLLMGNADLALYGAKEDGRGRYRMFEASMNARIQARRSLELDLRRAIARQEFALYYQPQVDARTGTYDGAEALIRWRHPERGLVSPADFIPLAEETGLIGILGEWVLRTACTEALAWPEHLTVAVNLSPVQFRDARLAATIRNILAETGFPAARLELEITEGSLLQDEQRTLSILRELRALGIRISMDDFGTGYSSLSYLSRFPFDKIKIDQSFVRRTPHDKDSAAIVRAIAMLGASLGMKTTAEGVETDVQSNFIAGQGCDQLQGYLISRPVPADAIADLFAASVPRRATA
ncbi:bifunctional diguanylate cyclase/phosphodiesterase [Methylobacterium soli]|uniref:EAL domain-containing protein n=1 Tax=Methylobacterium soli TaxID=553447 RepID=A0A6L3T208_9HYPH|nr:EAL domain-containing protein [Methylobacterium soli]KAB1078767.1 EAL domain-containing protein [Methylobacterium soli]GJE42246.1 putative signaling protein [Methylobacterium soli]